MVLAYTAHAASQAARDGARAFSLGSRPVAAAQASLPGAITPGERLATGPDHGVTVDGGGTGHACSIGDGTITRIGDDAMTGSSGE